MTAGILPATMHRVVAAPTAAGAGASTSSGSSSRLSLCFMLHAAPDALLAPAQITGTAADRLPVRYRVPKTTKQLLIEFDAAHASIHGPTEAQQQQHQPAKQQQRQRAGQQQQVVVPAAAATAMASANWIDYQAQKRQCLRNITDNILAAGLKQQEDCKTLIVTFLSQVGNGVQFKLNQYAPLSQAMEKWSELYPAEQPGPGWRFLFDGLRLVGSDTPHLLNIEDGDIIDVFIDSLGD